MSATTHSEVRSAARPMSLLAFTTASGLVGRDVCLLELGLRVAVGRERDTGFGAAWWPGLSRWPGWPSYLAHAVDEPGGAAGDEHGSDQAMPSEAPRL
jgi:hypothetical protein